MCEIDHLLTLPRIGRKLNWPCQDRTPRPLSGRLEMAARIQRTCLLLAFACVLGWFAYAVADGRPQVALLGGLVVAVGCSLLIAIEFLLLVLHARMAGDPISIRTVPLMRAFAGELLAAVRVFCWQQAFQANAWSDHLPEEAASRRGVVLVHGYLCNRGLWNSWLNRLREAEIPFVAVSLEPPNSSIDEYVAQIEGAVQRLEACTGMAPVAVGHSMGGLALRNWWSPSAPSLGGGSHTRLHRLITIGTPHHGTWMANFAITRNAREMQLGSPWISALFARESVVKRTMTTCFYSAYDNIGFPASAATLSGADNRELGAVAHVAMIEEAAPYLEVLAQLETSNRLE